MVPGTRERLLSKEEPAKPAGRPAGTDAAADGNPTERGGRGSGDGTRDPAALRARASFPGIDASTGGKFCPSIAATVRTALGELLHDRSRCVS